MLRAVAVAQEAVELALVLLAAEGQLASEQARRRTERASCGRIVPMAEHANEGSAECGGRGAAAHP